MNTEEFLRTITPAAKHSQLAPWWVQIQELRACNCTLSQVCDFLAVNGVEITIAGLSKYIKRREAAKNHAGQETQPSSHRKVHTSHAISQRPTNGNPLRALGGSRRSGEHNPVPQAKPEFDE